MPNGLFYRTHLDRSITNKRGVRFSSFYYYIPVLNTNSVDPDQTLYSAASDLGLHCLPKSLLLCARHEWVNFMMKTASNSMREVTNFAMGGNQILIHILLCSLVSSHVCLIGDET